MLIVSIARCDREAIPTAALARISAKSSSRRVAESAFESARPCGRLVHRAGTVLVWS